MRVVENHAEITPLPDNPIKGMRGILKGGKSLANELLAERKKDNMIDEKNTLLGHFSFWNHPFPIPGKKFEDQENKICKSPYHG